MKEKSEKFYKINNRKYLGSKTKLLDQIFETIENETGGNYKTVIDLFSGTGVVSDMFIKKGKKVIMNDFLDSNNIIYKAFFSKENKTNVSIKKLLEIRDYFNYEKKLKNKNYFSNFGGKYFTQNDADLIGGIREEIENLFRNKKINDQERNILIASLIYSSDRAANSMGHYEIYIDRKIEDKFEFDLIEIKEKFAKKIYNEDSNSVIKKISGDVLYLDPPYNSRQYSNLYHLLDNLANWDNPSLNGKGLKPPNPKKSLYSMKDAREAMLDLVLNADVKYIFISYNNTNAASNSRTAAKISNEEMFEILSLRGETKKIEIDFNPYNTGNSKLENYKEIIYVCKVKTETLGKKLVKYPFNYMGGKFKLLKEILPISNSVEKNFFVDMFCGGANVAVNSGYKKIFAFDVNERQIEILNTIKNEKTFTLLEKLDNVIEKFSLSQSHKFGYEYYDGRGNSGLKEFNNQNYLKLRDYYNQKREPILLMVLLIFSFNNSMNFNLKGEFNVPCGKRDFNSQMRKNFINFSQKLKIIDIEFIHSDFRSSVDFIKKGTTKKLTFYLDPPYISGFAHYNKNWGENEEGDLLKIIKKLSENDSFILSNSLEIGTTKNRLLEEFINKNNFSLIRLDNDYDNSWFFKKEKGNKEIILTNITK